MRAHQCANRPRFSNRLDPIESVPSTIVYTVMAGIRKKTVRHQWKGGNVNVELPTFQPQPPTVATAVDARGAPRRSLAQGSPPVVPGPPSPNR